MNLSMLQPLYNGFVTTFQFFIFTLILSIPLGLIIALLAQRFSKTLGLIVNGYVYLFRGTPLLLQMTFFKPLKRLIERTCKASYCPLGMAFNPPLKISTK